jgi:type II secretory pathway component GspD/PulD (secretin)
VPALQGKTLILSGLYEGVDLGGCSKTPGVGDVPGVDTLFNARHRQERRDVALVLRFFQELRTGRGESSP